MADVAKQINTSQDFMVNFMMGGVSAVVFRLLVQNQDEMIKDVIDCFQRTYTGEGLRSFWRSNNANVITLRLRLEEGWWKWVGGNEASGAAAGASSSVFVYSPNFARTCLASDAKLNVKGSERQYNGIIDVYRKTVQSDGIAGLYRGFVPSIVGIIVYRGLYFGLYDTLSKPILLYVCTQLTLPPEPVVLVGPLQGSVLASFLLGCRRMMTTSGTSVHYMSIFYAGAQIMAKEGPESLFKGMGTNIFCGVASARVLALYDQVQAIAFGEVYAAGSG
ncbi:hypothetical protein FRC06_004798 [Ceratobasidium sp. 370]|nr:hypothetical protein FRC06_004798 [Ceratobasidium sp. 370]